MADLPFPTYLGPIATRTFFPNVLDTGNSTLMSRSYHIARDTITQLQIALPNFYVTGGTGETAPTGTVVFTASIEYPAGTFTQVKFGGASTSPTVANGSFVLSDFVTVNIPNGTPFWVRIFLNNSGASSVVHKSDVAKSTALGDAQIPGGTDLTMGGTVIDTGGLNYSFWPAAILGVTKNFSVFIVGDSRCVTTTDAINDATGDNGELTRALGPRYGYINGGVSGDTAKAFLASHTARLAIGQYASHVIIQSCLNDVGASRSLSQVQQDLVNIRSLFPQTIKFLTTTEIGNTTSTDSWATVQNQTPQAPFTRGPSDVMALLNAWKRGLALPPNLANGSPPLIFDGFIEVSDIIETARDSGIWKAPGFTNDGIHPSPGAFSQIATALSGIALPSSWVAPNYESQRNARLAGTTDQNGITTPVVSTLYALPPPVNFVHTTVAMTNASVLALASNPNAKYRLFQNVGTVNITLAANVAAVAGTQIVLYPNQAYEMSLAGNNLDSRVINVIGVSGNLLVTEGV